MYKIHFDVQQKNNNQAHEQIVGKSSGRSRISQGGVRQSQGRAPSCYLAKYLQKTA